MDAFGVLPGIPDHLHMEVTWRNLDNAMLSGIADAETTRRTPQPPGELGCFCERDAYTDHHVHLRPRQHVVGASVGRDVHVLAVEHRDSQARVSRDDAPERSNSGVWKSPSSSYASSNPQLKGCRHSTCTSGG